ncbi:MULTISPECIES: hypothetical protein [unclassified Shewanella]|uniref:hypothetical protein n=1 Tax=unclassified Shewanella TaxID=196818 RepID=UPI0012FECDE8|nr:MULTISPECIES: hypothetical protein [unclassified Shewanella]
MGIFLMSVLGHGLQSRVIGHFDNNPRAVMVVAVALRHCRKVCFKMTTLTNAISLIL